MSYLSSWAGQRWRCGRGGEERTSNQGDETARDTVALRDDGEAARPEAAPSGSGEAARDAESPPEPAPARSDASRRVIASRETSLVEAVLRTGASLDLETVLKEVVESARALTGAAYGVITTVDERGEPRDFVTSGLMEEGRQTMEARPDGLRLFANLRSLDAPPRLPNLDTWVRALGRAPFRVLCGAFQATPMRHRAAAVVGFFLGGLKGGFMDADEEVLALFAQQAAAA